MYVDILTMTLATRTLLRTYFSFPHPHTNCPLELFIHTASFNVSWLTPDTWLSTSVILYYMFKEKIRKYICYNLSKYQHCRIHNFSAGRTKCRCPVKTNAWIDHHYLNHVRGLTLSTHSLVLILELIIT